MADERIPVGQLSNVKLLQETSTTTVVAEMVSISSELGFGGLAIEVWGTSTGAAVVTDTTGTMQSYNRGLVVSVGSSTATAADAGGEGSLSAKLRRATDTLGTSTGAAVTTDAVGTLQNYMRGLVSLLDRTVVVYSGGTSSGGALSLVTTTSETFRLLSVTAHTTTVPAASENLTIQVDSATSSGYDTILGRYNMGTLSASDLLFTPDSDLLYKNGDVIAVTYANTTQAWWGAQITVETFP